MDDATNFVVNLITWYIPLYLLCCGFLFAGLLLLSKIDSGPIGDTAFQLQNPLMFIPPLTIFPLFVCVFGGLFVGIKLFICTTLNGKKSR